MTATLTFSVDRSVSALLRASIEPCTSALTTSLSSLTSPLCHELLNLIETARHRGCGSNAATGPLARIGDFLRLALVGDLVEEVASRRKLRQPEHLDGRCRTGCLDGVAAIVGHRAHPSVSTAGDNIVTRLKRAVAYQHIGYRTATAVQIRFEHDTLGGNRIVGAKLE